MKRRLVAICAVVVLGLSIAVPLTVSVQGDSPQYVCHYTMTLNGEVRSESYFNSETDATNSVQRGPALVDVTCDPA
jgi:hypothetical protein